MSVPMTKEQAVRAWPDFYDNPVIQHLGTFRAWTITQPEDKKPMSFYAMRHFLCLDELVGAHKNEPLDRATLDELVEAFPNAANNALQLNGFDQGYIVLDIEKTATRETRERMLALPWLYAETSMSGRGLHLVLPLPYDLFARYPYAQLKNVLKAPDGTWEALIADHWVTFTRNALTGVEPGDASLAEVLEPLMQAAKPPVDRIKMEAIPDPDEVLAEQPRVRRYLLDQIQPFGKTVADYANDNSRFDYAACIYYVRSILSAIDTVALKEPFTPEKCVSLVIDCMNRYETPRSKWTNHYVQGVPWLVYEAETAYACVVNGDRR